MKVFEKTHVEINVYRWVVFVLWLKPHPSAWRWYRSIQKAHPQRVLQQDLAYTLHKPRRRRFSTLSVIVGGLDDQWVADLVEVQPLAKYNRGIRYLLTVLNVLTKYTWVQPLKTKTGVALVKAFDKILKQGRQLNGLQTDQGTEFYNRTFQRWVKDHGMDHFST